MLIDFLHWSANAIIFLIILRVLQARTAGTEWGKVLAFFG